MEDTNKQDVLKRYKVLQRPDSLMLTARGTGDGKGDLPGGDNLQYPLILADGTKHVLKFSEGVCHINKKELPAVAKAYEALKASGKLLPFTDVDEFEASISRAPIKIERNGEVIEITPEKINELLDMEEKAAKKEPKETKTKEKEEKAAKKEPK